MKNALAIQVVAGLMAGTLGVGMAPRDGIAADAKSLAVTAVVLSRNICRFSSGEAASLNFGTLDPSNASDTVASTSFSARCEGSAPLATFAITHDSGQNETAPGQPRLRHATAPSEFIGYTLAINPASGTVARNTNFQVTITGTIPGGTYRSAMVGNYADTVVLTLSP